MGMYIGGSFTVCVYQIVDQAITVIWLDIGCLREWNIKCVWSQFAKTWPSIRILDILPNTLVFLAQQASQWEALWLLSCSPSISWYPASNKALGTRKLPTQFKKQS